MINNIEPAYLPDGTQTAAAHNPPSLVRTIGDELSDENITWAYYGGAWNDYRARCRPRNPRGQSDQY
jgi:phospholipase C